MMDRTNSDANAEAKAGSAAAKETNTAAQEESVADQAINAELCREESGPSAPGEPGAVDSARKKRKTDNAKPKGKHSEKNAESTGVGEEGDSGVSGDSRKERKTAASESADGDPDDMAGCGSNADGSETDAETAQNASTKNELAEERDRYLRLAAEYDNFRKRSIKERETAYGNSRADTITRLLPVYDNLERALKMECADEAFYKGVELTMTGFCEILEGMDVKPINAVGQPFDPNRHNAVMSIENPELGDKIVAEEFQKGFMLGERVIRFSTVVVAN